jgi:Mg-chelatase subunit ChlI
MMLLFVFELCHVESKFLTVAPQIQLVSRNTMNQSKSLTASVAAMLTIALITTNNSNYAQAATRTSDDVYIESSTELTNTSTANNTQETIDHSRTASTHMLKFNQLMQKTASQGSDSTDSTDNEDESTTSDAQAGAQAGANANANAGQGPSQGQASASGAAQGSAQGQSQNGGVCNAGAQAGAGANAGTASNGMCIIPRSSWCRC